MLFASENYPVAVRVLGELGCTARTQARLKFEKINEIKLFINASTLPYKTANLNFAVTS